MDIGIGILAGGNSRRMGEDKAKMRLDGKEFLLQIAGELGSLGEVLVSVRDPEQYPRLPFRAVPDAVPGAGPMEGIRQLLIACGKPWLFVCATDMPHIRKELVCYLRAFIDPAYDCIAPLDERGPHPMGALYSRDLLPALEVAVTEGRHKMTRFLQSVRTHLVPMVHSPFSPSILTNVNTPEEYRALLEGDASHRPSPPVFCISGVKNSGKTGLLTQLLAELRPFFPKIGVIKHDGHDFGMDREGTDTHAFSQAGAAETAIFSDKRSALLSHSPPFHVEEFIAAMGKVDLILLEGFKQSGYPKIEVVRKGVSQRPVCRGPSLVAIASDLDAACFSDLGLPVLPLGDTHGIAKMIRDRLR